MRLSCMAELGLLERYTPEERHCTSTEDTALELPL